ncbi:MAG: M20 metallopeptidase family protein [Caldisericaceae bacterium]
MDKVSEEVFALKDEVVSLRRDFHMYPEIGFEERRTSRIVQEYLRNVGIDVSTVAGTGVLGYLDAGKTKTLLLRADMDALPIQELNDVPYKSKNAGIMHACGHDAHTAMLLVASKIISKHRDELNVNVKFAFQPSEEKDPGGAIKMIEEGILENPSVDRAFGLHLGNFFPAGTVYIKNGPFMAEPDSFVIKIKGKGGHGAYPHKSVDPILIASQIVVSLQSIVSREIDPIDSVVVTVGKISSGDAFNVIPETAILEGTVRTIEESVAKSMPGRIERIAKNIAKALGGDAELSYSFGYPPLVNDEESANYVRKIAATVVGGDNVVEAPISMGGEDMAYFLQKVKGAYFWLGSSNKEKGLDKPHHSAFFDFDEDVLAIGVELHTRLALNLFK